MSSITPLPCILLFTTFPYIPMFPRCSAMDIVISATGRRSLWAELPEVIFLITSSVHTLEPRINMFSHSCESKNSFCKRIVMSDDEQDQEWSYCLVAGDRLWPPGQHHQRGEEATGGNVWGSALLYTFTFDLFIWTFFIPFQVISSEASYLKSLNILISHFIQVQR